MKSLKPMLPSYVESILLLQGKDMNDIPISCKPRPNTLIKFMFRDV